MIVNALITTSIFRNAHYNWDMIPYAALALQVNGYYADEIHDEAYEQIKNNVSGAQYYNLIDPNNNYRNTMFTNAEKFEDEIKFYTVKPMFILSVASCYFLGVNIASATVLPCCISYFLIGCILFLWLTESFKTIYAALFSILIMLAPFMRETASISTPDMLCCFFLLLGFYLFHVKQKLTWGTLALSSAILTRPDSIILVALILGFGYFLKRVTLKYILISLLAMTLSVALIIWLSGFPISSLFLNINTQERLNVSYGNIPIMKYLHSYYAALDSIQFTFVREYLTALLLSFGLNIVLKKANKTNENYFVPTLLLLHFILLFLVNPVLDDRYIIANYTICLVYLLLQVKIIVENKMLVNFRA